MEVTIGAEGSVDTIELIDAHDESVERARTRTRRARRSVAPDAAAEAAHLAWLTQPARTQVRRPLSPVCPLIIGERLPPPRFWRRAGVQRALPWIGSIALHLALMVIGLLTFHVERPRIRGGIPIESSITTAEASLPTNMAATMSPPKLADAGETPQIDHALPMPNEPQLTGQETTASGDSLRLPNDRESEPLMFGIGANESIGAPHVRSASESPAKVSTGATEARFFGVAGTGQAVVYVCDASGSMMATSDVMVSQLQRALLAMHASQVFNVIFFSGNRSPVAFDARNVVPADADNKLAAFGFAKRYSCGGNSRGLAAITSALSRNPDLIYLVTDGDFDDSDSILATIRSMNADRFTTINVILVSGAAGNDPDSYKFLKQIADENGGTCRIVDPNRM